MKSQTLPTKRKPVSKGVFRKLSAVTSTRRRKQRAATTASSRDFEDGQASARIGRALFVILLIHLLAVAMIFIHHRFLSERPIEEVSSAQSQEKVVEAPKPVVKAATQSGVVSSHMAPNEKPYIVSKGETYTSIAAAHQISEKDLRALNGNAGIRPGYLLKIPVKRVVIKTPQTQAEAQLVKVQRPDSVAELAPAPAVPARDRGLVEAVDTRNVPRATAVPISAGSGGKYVVQKGDTVWRIAHRHGVDQEALKEANGITDPRKLRVGMTLRIP